MRPIDLIYFNAGGGHRAAATALESVIQVQQRPWQPRLVNLFEVLDRNQLFRKTTGMNPEDYYNARLARGWTMGLAQELKLLQALIRLGHATMVKQLRRHWRRTQPHLVVSLVPNFNRAMYSALSQALPSVAYVTILTDIADYPPHFWIEPHQAQHFICGSRKAVEQARATACADAQIHATSGMIIRPDFYATRQVDRRAELKRLGLDSQRPVGLVMFGGHGSKAMATIARQLHDTQLILICGHNSALADKLRAMPSSTPRCVLGFTQDIQLYMQLSDFFIGKPGPGSISEALQQRLPVIVVRNGSTMPQERYNTDWVRENNVGIVLKSFDAIDAGVAELQQRRQELDVNIGKLQNRALFEIPDILAKILEGGPTGAAAVGLTPTRRVGA